MVSLSQISLLVVIFLISYNSIHSSPVSFPQGPSEYVHKNSQDEVPAEEEAQIPTNGITAPPPISTDDGPTVADLVSQFPQILDGIQNYINSASAVIATNQTESVPNGEIAGLISGFFTATNNFVQQLLQPEVEGESETTDHQVAEDNNNQVE